MFIRAFVFMVMFYYLIICIFSLVFITLCVLFIGTRPWDYFNLLVHQEFLDLIVEQTNVYAEEVFLSKADKIRSRISNWKPLTVQELKIFLGLTLHMGTIHLSRIQDYWKRDRLFDLRCFSDYMGRDRYLLILRCLHFATNPAQNEAKPNDRLYKVRPLINYFNKRMCEVYYPGKELSLDESMVLWRGRLQFRQYIKNKRHKYGIKLYMLTEPNGIILNFAIYTGSLDDFGGKGHASKIVLHLMEGKLDSGHSVYLDNFYNSYLLSKDLLDRNTYSTGTLRIDRKHAPIEVKQKKLSKGETICRYTKGVMIGKWRDKRDVCYISTEFENVITSYEDKRGKEKSKPLPIFNYNKYMGGIDRQDQFMAYYPSTRKSVRWYKKIGIHVVQMLLLNSYLLFNKYQRKISFYDFRLEIIKELLPEDMQKKTSHKIMTHYLSHCDQSPKTKKTLRKKCKLCNEKGFRKDTPYECKSCGSGFCLDPCFREFHENLK